ncbi:MAG: energy-converting hydrogenase subunit [Methanobacterium sp.]|jgi:energy-converting hydrogenase B subunit I|uniref:MnhB domain-containing protein n=1 Tax=Methanobacterium sp. TaxID=2164 RepID=UPI0003C9CDCE|nr:MnhB domain-containing protein [Methanobacterium sp.]MDI3549921.1 energy-converting hydrogenase subunit [Methanobacterium sp.]CDG65887.1 Na+/H+ antiporter MnhB subunit-like protein [Methanobacterium sp. MB1]
MSTILKIFVFPASMIIMCLGVLTILGGHITPGGGFQGGAMIAAGFIFCLIVYGLKESPFHLSHDFLSGIETVGALVYIGLGLAGLAFSGFFLYNLGVDLYGIVPAFIKNLFNYPDPTHAGIIPYLNYAVGLKVMVGLTAVVITFMGFNEYKNSSEEEIEEEGEIE